MHYIYNYDRTRFEKHVKSENLNDQHYVQED